MGKPFRGRPSRREIITANNAAQNFYAGASERPDAQESLGKLLVVLPPKRERVVRPVDGKPAVPLESAVNDEIHNAVKHRPQVKLWRNNRGVAQYGNSTVVYGVGPRGASDWIGYIKETITQEMVGQTFARFVAVEAKRPGGRPDDDQQRFINQVLDDGGRAGCATCGDDAWQIIVGLL